MGDASSLATLGVSCVASLTASQDWRLDTNDDGQSCVKGYFTLITTSVLSDLDGNFS